MAKECTSSTEIAVVAVARERITMHFSINKYINVFMWYAYIKEYTGEIHKMFLNWT